LRNRSLKGCHGPEAIPLSKMARLEHDLRRCRRGKGSSSSRFYTLKPPFGSQPLLELRNPLAMIVLRKYSFFNYRAINYIFIKVE
jgi:hypothetical protein